MMQCQKNVSKSYVKCDYNALCLSCNALQHAWFDGKFDLREVILCRKSWFRVLTLVMGHCVALMGSAQEHPWFDPEHYTRNPDVVAFAQVAQSFPATWHRAQSQFRMPNGKLRQVQICRDKESQLSYMVSSGDMRWVSLLGDSLVNLSVSEVVGFNGGALFFTHQDELYSLGGYGLWRKHFDLLRFDGGPTAWEFIALEGDMPEDRDKDNSKLHFDAHQGKVWLLEDAAILSPHRYGQSGLDVRELDLKTRQWRRLGEIDARVGLIERALSLGSGLLAENGAGELLWMDFKNMEVSVLPRQAEVLDTFLRWNLGPGRHTYVGESVAWHAKGGDTVQLNVPWMEFEKAAKIPLLSEGGEEPMDGATGEALTLNERRPISWLPWLLFLAASVGFLSMLRRKSSSQRQRHFNGGKEEFSGLTLQLIEGERDAYETEEMDELLGIAHLSSPETLRSQRARLISRINTEFRVVHGKDLIVRKRSQDDRRRSLYCIER